MESTQDKNTVSTISNMDVYYIQDTTKRTFKFFNIIINLIIIILVAFCFIMILDFAIFNKILSSWLVESKFIFIIPFSIVGFVLFFMKDINKHLLTRKEIDKKYQLNLINQINDDKVKNTIISIINNNNKLSAFDLVSLIDLIKSDISKINEESLNEALKKIETSKEKLNLREVKIKNLNSDIETIYGILRI